DVGSDVGELALLFEFVGVTGRAVAGADLQDRVAQPARESLRVFAAGDAYEFGFAVAQFAEFGFGQPAQLAGDDVDVGARDLTGGECRFELREVGACTGAGAGVAGVA